MAVVSIPMVVGDKTSDLAWWKVYDETHLATAIKQQWYYEKLLLHGKPHVTSFTSFVVAAPKTSPELAREKALAYVHEAREAVGAKRLTKLPRGRVGQGSECVRARALPRCIAVCAGAVQFKDQETAECVARAWATTANYTHVALPEALGDFVMHFDARHYEDLIA